MTATTMKQAAEIIQSASLPIELVIPAEADFRKFTQGVRQHLRNNKVVVWLRNASTKDAQIIYVC